MDPLEPIRSIKHGTVVLENDNTVVYVDPFEIEDDERDADLIIITHSHPDHFSPKDIRKINQPDTCYATTPKIAAKLEREMGIDKAYISILTYDTPPTAFECGAIVMPLPAENENHPLDEGFGVFINFADFKYYITGDTDIFAQSISCDVMFAVCDGIHNMKDYLTRVPAQIKAMDNIPSLVVPYHCSADNAASLCIELRREGINCKSLF